MNEFGAVGMTENDVGILKLASIGNATARESCLNRLGHVSCSTVKTVNT